VLKEAKKNTEMPISDMKQHPNSDGNIWYIDLGNKSKKEQKVKAGQVQVTPSYLNNVVITTHKERGDFEKGKYALAHSDKAIVVAFPYGGASEEAELNIAKNKANDIRALNKHKQVWIVGVPNAVRLVDLAQSSLDAKLDALDTDFGKQEKLTKFSDDMKSVWINWVHPRIMHNPSYEINNLKILKLLAKVDGKKNLILWNNRVSTDKTEQSQRWRNNLNKKKFEPKGDNRHKTSQSVYREILGAGVAQQTDKILVAGDNSSLVRKLQQDKSSKDKVLDLTRMHLSPLFQHLKKKDVDPSRHHKGRQLQPRTLQQGFWWGLSARASKMVHVGLRSGNIENLVVMPNTDVVSIDTAPHQHFTGVTELRGGERAAHLHEITQDNKEIGFGRFHRDTLSHSPTIMGMAEEFIQVLEQKRSKEFGLDKNYKGELEDNLARQEVERLVNDIVDNDYRDVERLGELKEQLRKVILKAYDSTGERRVNITRIAKAVTAFLAGR